MNDTIKRDRSPSCPTATLQVSLEQIKLLYSKAGKAKVSPITAVGAIGYNGLNGAALTTLATLRSYGLIDRERGEGIVVSPSAIKLLHPTDKAQEDTLRRELALRPQVFNQLFAEGFNNPDPDVLSNHLVQSGFTSDRARKASAVYCANYEFAKLSESSKSSPSEVSSNKGSDTKDNQTIDETNNQPAKPKVKVLATYSIPLGANEAKLEFTGVQELQPDDFDALIEYVALFKKQLERRIQAEDSAKIAEPPKPQATSQIDTSRTVG